MSLDLRPESLLPVGSTDELLGYFASAEKPREAWRIGLEHEKHAVKAGSPFPVPYGGRRGIRELIARARRFGYVPFVEEGHPIAAERQEPWLSLEPGGQVELSGRPADTAVEVAGEHLRHYARLRALGKELGVRFLGVGYRPFGRVEEMPWMPKRRYALMREYLPARGPRALDMMLMTASVQTSLDWESEEDCREKVRAAAGMVPLLVAMFANSPVAQGLETGYQSFRMRVWQEVDSDRCGLPSLFFDEEGFSYRRYLTWALRVPMIFIRRRGRYLRMGGLPFERFLAEGHLGERATLVDFSDHLSTLFPDVRLKRVLEIRSADACDLATSNALPALCKGVLYDPQACGDVCRLTQWGRPDEWVVLRASAAREGLRATVPGAGKATVRDVCRALLALAEEGLRRQGAGQDVRLLDPLWEIVTTGRTHADALVEALRSGGREAVLERCALP